MVDQMAKMRSMAQELEDLMGEAVRKTVSSSEARDARMMALAWHVAGWSKDPSTKVGAVAVGRDPREIALGYNGFPPGIADTPSRLADKATKYALTQHAERNVLDNARFDLTGATLYCTAFPCAECAKSIVSKKIHRVVTTPPPAADPARPWTTTFAWTMDLFAEAGIKLEVFNSGGER